MPDQARPSGTLAATIVRLAALWVLAGACYKLFSGSPNDLPPIVREFFLGPDLTFRLAIAIELSIALTALVVPRVGWALLVAQFAVFLAILVQLMLSGVSSCGCFGSKVTISPRTMFTIDTICLLAILASKPWRIPKRDREPSLLIPLVGTALAFLAPFVYIESASNAVVAQRDAETGAWKPLEGIEKKRYAELYPSTWVGKDIHDTELAAYMDVDAQVTDGTWILYRVSCDHCATYLRHLYESFDPAEGRFCTYVRLSEEGDEEARVVNPDHLAYGMEAVLPELAWVVTTPWRLELEGGVVKEAVDESEFDEAAAAEAAAGAGETGG